MSEWPVSLAYTRDEELLRRLRGYLHGRTTIEPTADPAGLLLFLRRQARILLFVDLCGPEIQMLLPRLRQEFPDTLVIALGDVRSATAQEALQAGVHAVEEADPGRIRIQSLFDQSQRLLQAHQENRLLREELHRAAPPSPPEPGRIAPGLHHFSGALRRFDDIDTMLESLVEGIAGCTRISRVGVFSTSADGTYTFRAGVKCLESTRNLLFEPPHPFVQWLEIHAHSIARPMLHHIEPIDQRQLLETSLDAMGSEAILPLFGRTRLIGWILLGRPASGIPFTRHDIEELSQLAGQISAAVENALLHDRLAMQKNLAETLLQSIPVGIISIGSDGTIRWFNRSAERFLQGSAEALIHAPAENLPSLPASLLRDCLATGSAVRPVQWTEPESGRPLWIETRPLLQDGTCIGAMAVLKDATEEQILREKQNSLERAEFWNELAGAISHEVRNPLVSISTFSQLLPEKYADEEFRTQFRDLTQKEVERLTIMINQLDTFANRPTASFASVDPRVLIEEAIEQFNNTHPDAPPVAFDPEPDLPRIHADADLVIDAILRLLDNAVTATVEISNASISIRAGRGEIGNGRPAVWIDVCDNGTGIPESLLDQVFSPFYTTKPTGIGLGLPIVRRTLIDHEGWVRIDSGKSGTTVRLTLPALSP